MSPWQDVPLDCIRITELILAPLLLENTLFSTATHNGGFTRLYAAVLSQVCQRVVYHIHLPLSGPCRLNDESCFWKQSEKWWCQTIETAFMLSTACKIWSSQRHIQSWLLMAPTSLHARPVTCSTTVHLESFSECHASSISPAAQHSEHRMHLRLSQPHCMAMVPDCLRFWALFFAKSKFLSMSYAEIMPNSCQVTSRAFCFTAIWVLMTWVLNPIPFEMNIAFFRLLINIGQQMISTMVPDSQFASIC